MAAVHETMEGIARCRRHHKQTMRRFDEAALRPSGQLKGRSGPIREREHVSQTVFANYLNVTSSRSASGRRGEKRPSGASLTAVAGREEWAATVA